MKKLMIAALVAAMGGVAMADCDVASCALAYRMKLAGKTVKGKAIAAKSECDAAQCWAKPASLRIAGYLYSQEAKAAECDACECVTPDALVPGKFWDENKNEVEFAPAIDLFEILRNSGLKNKAQIHLTAGTINLAGFAVYNPETLKIKSASGFFAGKIDGAPQCGTYDAKTCEYGNVDSYVYAPCTLEAAPATAAIAYGRWSLTYKADKVALLKKGAKPEEILVPTGFKTLDAQEVQ